MSIRQTLNAAVKEAMRAKDKTRLATLRTLSAAFKQVEIDQRVEVTDDIAIAVLTKQKKQRQDAAAQFRAAARDDLAAQEEAEIAIIGEFLPTPLSAEEISSAIDEAIAALDGAVSMAAMGAVMKQLTPRLQGRADMAQVSALVRQKLQA